jgi:GTP diphosphokinase / guanosine-3',5'-bis(diphosphate) 3'-diphosphatase
VIILGHGEKMDLRKILDSAPDYYTPADIELIERAFDVAESAHKGQTRMSGEPYINHCLSVAYILIEMKMPSEVISAGLLHDTVEDTDIDVNDIKKEFGEEIAKLVNGVTKLIHLPRVSRGDQHSSEDNIPSNEEILPDSDKEKSRSKQLADETLRKTFLAMGDDIRVVLIKLADRLHNMRTLGHMPDHKQSRIGKETLDIFAPLASRLGIWQIKWELEDLGFRYTNPDSYKEIANYLADRRSEREHQIEDIVTKLSETVIQHGIQADISGRPKHIYSIYRKMLKKNVSFNLVRDVRAVRIIVKDIPTCYSVLGLIHTRWRPFPGEFDDYIAAPKDNFYQSLHTAVIYEDGKTLEVQIRTTEMHENAEYGVAAHWRYKDGSEIDDVYENRIAHLRQLMEWIQDVEDATEFVDSMKTDVFGDRVYVFTPAGDIIDLPAGATSLDFAYHVHTEVGHRCRGAKVNGKLEALSSILKTGDQVEIITAKRGGPSRDWLNINLGMLNTNRAKSKVRYWFKKQGRETNLTSGKTILDREMRRLGIPNIDYNDIASKFNHLNEDELFVNIGVGEQSINRIINFITDKEITEEDEFSKFFEKEEIDDVLGDESVAVQGVKGLLTTMGKCCKPAPGDQIIGYITRGRGATVHRQDCPNILSNKDKERLVRVDWGEKKTTYPVDVRVDAIDRDGLLKDVSVVIAEEGMNMRSFKVDIKGNQAVFNFILEVIDIVQLTRILTKLESLDNILDARRVSPG